MSKHLGTIYRISVAPPTTLHVGEARELSCYGMKWIGMEWWSMCQQAAAVPGPLSRWTGESGWDGSRFTGASHPRGCSPPCLRRGFGAQCWFSLEKGRPYGSLQISGGRGEGSIVPALHLPAFCTRAGTDGPLSTQTGGSPWFQAYRLTLLEHLDRARAAALFQQDILKSLISETLRGGKVLYFASRVCWKAKPSYTCRRGRQEFTTSNNNKEVECFFRNLSMILMA